MIGRVRQFYRALTARLTAADVERVKKLLPAAAQPLFFTMHPTDQYHAFMVARTAKQLAEELSEREQYRLNNALLIRACLLHDVGRKRGDLDIAGKVWAVLLTKLLPTLSKRLAESKRGGALEYITHGLYVYYHHPEIGAARLRAAGLTAEAAIIAGHHLPVTVNDSLELRLLKQADELN